MASITSPWTDTTFLLHGIDTAAGYTNQMVCLMKSGGMLGDDYRRHLHIKLSSTKLEPAHACVVHGIEEYCANIKHYVLQTIGLVWLNCQQCPPTPVSVWPASGYFPCCPIYTVHVCDWICKTDHMYKRYWYHCVVLIIMAWSISPYPILFLCKLCGFEHEHTAIHGNTRLTDLWDYCLASVTTAQISFRWTWNFRES